MSDFIVADASNTKVGDVVVYAGLRSDTVGWAYLVTAIETRPEHRFITHPVVHPKRTFENETGDQGPTLPAIRAHHAAFVKATKEHVEDEKRKFAVCPRCAGHGTHANPAFDGMTGDDLDEMGEEQYDFIEEYTSRGGMYDVNCERCSGQRVVLADCTCFECVGNRVIREEDEAQRRAEIAAGC